MPRQSTVLAKEIRSIRTSFSRLARSFGRLAPLLAAAQAGSAEAQMTGGKHPRRRPRLSAAQRRALKLQGKYMGTMRGLTPSKRSRIKKIRATRGIRAAIAAAERMVG